MTILLCMGKIPVMKDSKEIEYYSLCYPLFLCLGDLRVRDGFLYR